MTIDSALQAQVDAQLLEQGAFAVLEFLTDSGRLATSDYEGWRRREVDCLDEVLMGSKEKIRAQIEAAAGYAQSIGLVQQVQTFYPWAADGATGAAVANAAGGARTNDSAGSGAAARDHGAALDRERALRVSADPQLGKLIASRFVPAEGKPQLDLFFDNPVVALTNGIMRALSAGNLSDAQRQLDRLYAQAPNHADLAGFDRLLRALGHLNHAIDDPRQELNFLLKVTATAKRLMGSQARDLLAPLWRHLADALGSVRFSSDEPALHRSFALTQSQDWAEVCDSVLSEPQWWRHAPLNLRLAQASFYRHRRIEALTAWFHLCWRAPAQAADALDNDRQPDTGVAASWRQFVDSEEDLDTADFPSWLLLHEPGLALQVAVDLPTGETPAEEHYRCVHRWIQARRANRHSEEMALRRALQAGHPGLFQILKRSI
jgi:hypothetical protein